MLGALISFLTFSFIMGLFGYWRSLRKSRKNGKEITKFQVYILLVWSFFVLTPLSICLASPFFDFKSDEGYILLFGIATLIVLFFLLFQYHIYMNYINKNIDKFVDIERSETNKEAIETINDKKVYSVDTAKDSTEEKNKIETSTIIKQQVKYCKYCGKEIDTDSAFCSHCGKKIVE